MKINFAHKAIIPLLTAATLGALSLKYALGQPQVDSKIFATSGNPTSALETSDGAFVFVSVTNVGAPNFAGPDSAAGTRKDVMSGIEVFRRVHSGASRGQLEHIGFVRTGSTGANGLALLHGEKTLAVGVGDDGVAFLNVDDLIHGDAKPVLAAQGASAGTFDVAATPDGRYLFSSNEYGTVDGQRGNVGVIATHIDGAGHVTRPESVGQIATGDVVPSLALSPDGSRLYVASELVPEKNPPAIAGAHNPVLTKSDCVQKKGTAPRSNGFLTVIDIRRAVEGKPDAILSRVAAGCSPVRIVESVDASALFVSARGDDSILSYNPSLLVTDPEHAFLLARPSGGTAPVGMRLFDRDRWLAIANSNRFAGGDGNIAIMQVGNPKLSPSLRVVSAGAFPRNISRSGDGKRLLTTNYTSRSLLVLETHLH